mmetsp:Transcript_9123/g.17974  ORF Transcript_9123/g.17974 Transcript_9123/m.17974 type:complete len:635 (+) Transcript_9123:200-2104(+)
MADNVQRILEGMIPELEDLQERGIFEADEIREIVKTRRDFEYKLQRRAPRKEDFLRYAEYEISLEKLRKKRKKRKAIRKGGVGDKGGHRRISFVFERAVRRFKGDIAIWHRAIDYALKEKEYGVASKRFGEVLKLHPREIDFWIKAARFHFEANGDAATARSLLQTALRLNGDQAKLWAEYLRLEALHAYQIRRRRLVLGIDEEGEDVAAEDKDKAENEEEDDEVREMRARENARKELLFKGQVLEIVYKQAVKKLPSSAELRAELASALEPFTEDDSIMKDIAITLTRKIWLEATEGPLALSDNDKLAKCWLGRANFEMDQTDEESGDLWAPAQLLAEALEANQCPEMAEAYVEFLSQHQDDLDASGPPAKRRGARQAGESASCKAAFSVLDMDGLQISEDTLVTIADMDSENEALLEACMARAPSSLSLLYRCLQAPNTDLSTKWGLVQRACEIFVEKKLKMGDVKLRDEMQDMYLLYLNECVATESKTTTEVIREFERAIRWFYEHGRIEDGDAYMRVSRIISGLLDWVSSSRRVDLVTQIFTRLRKSAVPPVIPVPVYQRILMIYKELGAKPEDLRHVYTEATLQHTDNADLWVQFVKFEREFGNLKSERAAVVRASQHIPDLASLLDSA